MGTVRDVDPINLAVDQTTRVLAAVDYEHYEVHVGEMFRFCYIDEDIDSAETKEYLITAPDTTSWSHFVWHVTSSLKGKVEFFKDSTRTTTDTAETAYNANHNTTDQATLSIQTHTTTDGADGTRFDCASWGTATAGGSFGGGAGGEARSEAEVVTEQDGVYLFKFTSGAADNNLTIRFGWYEHTNYDDM